MSEKKFLDYNGLSYFWDKAKEYIEDNTIPKVNDASGKLPQFDANGNIVSSTKTINDFATAAQGTLANTALQPSDKGIANGVCPLNASVKIDSTYLPSYVDDVVEGYLNNNTFYSDSSYTDTIPSESGKIYIDLTTNKSYRWSGTQYTEITGGGLVIGTTSGTAFEGSRGLAIENNYLKAGESSGESSVTGFDPFEDTVHNIAQSLSSTQQIQARENINAQETLVSGTNIKTINMQNILGSGNIDTVNGYINANSVSDLNTNYPAGSIYSSKIALIPSQTTSGSLDYYTCTSNNNTWSWTLAGTTSPIVSVQEVDTYQPLIPIKSIPCWIKKSDGSFSSTSSVLVYVYDIEGHESIICDYSVIYGGNCCVAFYDEGFDPDDYENTYAASYLGWRYDRYLYGFSENTPVYNQLIYVNDDTTYGAGDITNAKYAVVTTLVSSNLHACRALTPVPQSLVKKTATPNVIIEFLTTIQKPFVTTMDSATNQEINETNTLSPWAVVFPTSYANIGRPTPVVAMLHGLGGFVTSQVMGYSGTGWVNTRQAYLDAGFAVMDINGTGISTESDANSKHWGNPCAIETLDKAFEYLKENYNVWDRLLIAGISMGAILAMGYAKCFPGKVAAVGCFAPNLFAYSMRYIGADSTSLKESAWQYQNHAAAAADNYKNLTGYVVLNECKVIDENGFIKEFEWPASMPSDWPANLADVKLVDSFPVPMRVWQGTADTEVNPNCSKLLVHSLRRGNSNATLRLCQDAGHDVQNVQYVRNEAVSWFKRFVNN